MRRLLPAGLAVLLLASSALSCTEEPPTGMGNDGEEEPYSHVRNPGRSANDFLADTAFTGLVVEVDYMVGFEPNAQALDSLRAFLEQRLNKTSVTILEPTEIPAGGQATYTANEVRALEEEHRDELTEGTTLAAYMIVVDGKYAQNDVLGIAYYNTSSAFFGAAYDQASGGIGQPSRLRMEATSFQHEFGHLFGLVAIEGSGTDMQTEHQDEENGHHCDNDQCLMYYAMESTDLFGSFFEGEIPPLDQNCIDDLRANGGK